MILDHFDSKIRGSQIPDTISDKIKSNANVLTSNILKVNIPSMLIINIKKVYFLEGSFNSPITWETLFIHKGQNKVIIAAKIAYIYYTSFPNTEPKKLTIAVI